MNHLEKNEITINKEIQSGKYRDCYLLYNRKSTDEPDNQKNSITYQKNRKCPLCPSGTSFDCPHYSRGLLCQWHNL